MGEAACPLPFYIVIVTFFKPSYFSSSEGLNFLLLYALCFCLSKLIIQQNWHSLVEDQVLPYTVCYVSLLTFLITRLKIANFICEKLYRYQKCSSNAFSTSLHSLDSQYLDGISITVGSPHKHVWSYATGYSKSVANRGNCSCAPSGASPPDHCLSKTITIMNLVMLLVVASYIVFVPLLYKINPYFTWCALLTYILYLL